MLLVRRGTNSVHTPLHPMTTMKHLVLPGLLLCLASGRAATVDGVVRAGESVTYVGAVLEYEAYKEWTEGGEALLSENARIISEYAALAKEQGADILVAPEYGLQSLEMHSANPQDFFSVTQYVPDPEIRVIPCGMNSEPENFVAVRALSCTALLNQIYLVVDLAEASPCNAETATKSPFPDAIDTVYECPPSGYIFYNTQIVFDRNGTLIARYRKKNLFLEPEFHPGAESDDTALFTTDFGVTFTLQICFDIAFPHPGLNNVVSRGVKDVIMSTAWVDSLPFLIAPSVQNGWSHDLGVNLLVSGYHWPERAKLGSGIYRGYTDLQHDVSFDSESGNRMIVAEVESVASVAGVRRPSHGIQKPRVIKGGIKNLTVPRKASPPSPRRDHLIYYDDLSNYTQTVLTSGASGETFEAQACHEDGLCCSLTYTATSSLTYSLVAYSGLITQGFHDYSFYAQVCSVLWCQTEDVNTCAHVDGGLPLPDEFGPFTLSASLTANFAYPALFSRNLTIADNDHYFVSGDGNVVIMSTQEPTANLLTAGFYARWYDRDP